LTKRPIATNDLDSIKDGFIERQVIVSKNYFKINLDVMNRFLDEWEMESAKEIKHKNE